MSTNTHTHTICIDVKVHDITKLYDAACLRYREENTEADRDEVCDMLGDGPPGYVDVTACLIMLLDPGTLPGCAILESRGAT